MPRPVLFPEEKKFFASRGVGGRLRSQRTGVATTEIERSKKRRAGRGNAFQHSRSGIRSDLGELLIRSNWEANVLRVLKLHGIEFEFEPKTFVFPPTAAGKVTSYLPDIYLPETDEFIEVKGYLDGKGRNKLRKFRKHYPNEFSRLTVVISRSNKANLLFFTKLQVPRILFYENISKLYSSKVDWEGIK